MYRAVHKTYPSCLQLTSKLANNMRTIRKKEQVPRSLSCIHFLNEEKKKWIDKVISLKSKYIVTSVHFIQLSLVYLTLVTENHVIVH